MKKQKKQLNTLLPLAAGLLGLFLLSAPQPSLAAKTIQACKKPLKQENCRSFRKATNPYVSVAITRGLGPNKLTAEGKFHVVAYRADKEVKLKRLTTAEAGTVIRVRYKKRTGKYIVRKGDKKYTANYPIRIVPQKQKHAVEIVNYERRPEWNPDINDNLFVGFSEVVYSEQDDRVYIVNRVPIERYVRGIGEVLNSERKAYQKTMLTAARTYALYKTDQPRGDVYDLDATDGSQIYLGENFARRAPRVVAAQRESKGMVVKYRGDLIIAPYFSRSDGRTRAWSEVWSGSYPWAQSVDDPCCDSRSLYGHGVGLSGEGARYFARERDWGYKKILKYYYQGVKIKKY
jgi:hypothetical protein